MNYLHTEASSHGKTAAGPPQVLHAARSNERPLPQPSHQMYHAKYVPTSGLSNRRNSSTNHVDPVGYQPPTPQGKFNSSRGIANPQVNQKALLTTQLNFVGSTKQQMYQSKRPAAINSGYSSRNTTQPDVAKTLAGLSNKKADVGRSNDYLRLKRVTNALAQQQQHNESSVKQKQRINEILAEKQQLAHHLHKGSMNGSGELSKKSGTTATTADSMPSKNTVAAERAARHARRLQKASSQGAQPPTTSGADEVVKVRIGMPGDEGVLPMRKAGSGTRVEQKVAEAQGSYAQLSQALAAQKSGNNFFVTKHSFVKANAGKRGATTKQPHELQGIILGNMKGQGGHIRQIKDLGSNPGSRAGSHKQNVRPGDQTTIIKKNQINPAGGVAAERFAQNSIVRGPPRIGMGAPLITKVGNGTARGNLVRESGSQGRSQIPGISQNGSGSHGAIQTTLGGAQNRPKKGSCHAIFQRVKGQVQIHGSLDSQGPQESTQPATSNSKMGSRKSSKVMIEDNQMENIPAEECIESKAYRINSIIEGPAAPKATTGTQQVRVINVAPMSSRSGDANKKLGDSGSQMRVVRVKGITRARNTGSVEASKQRDKSLVSTQHSTPSKGEDHELTLWTEIHKNLVAGDQGYAQTPMATHNVSKEYRTKMVDWMVEVTTSFKCTTRTYFVAVAIFDNYFRRMQGRKVLENSDVHLVGVGAMYLASKYEDIYPLHSKVVSEKISHGAFTQKQILSREEEYLRLFQFEMDFITSYDLHSTYVHLIKKRLGAGKDKDETRMLNKIEELSLLLIRMAMQNIQFTTYSTTMLVYTSFQAAATMLQLSKHTDETAAFFYSDFKLSFMRMANEIERSSPKSSCNRDFSLTGRQQVNKLSEKLIEFYKIFDSWHCGLNQLKTFKSLSFEISVATQQKVKQALDLATPLGRPSLSKQPSQ